MTFPGEFSGSGSGNGGAHPLKRVVSGEWMRLGLLFQACIVLEVRMILFEDDLPVFLSSFFDLRSSFVLRLALPLPLQRDLLLLPSLL